MWEYLVQLRDNVSAPADKATAAVEHLRTALQGLKGASEKALAALPDGFNKANKGNKDLSDSLFKSILKANLFTEALKKAGSAAISLAKTLIHDFINAAEFREDSIDRLATIFKDRQKAQDDFQDALRISQRSNFGSQAIVDSLATLGEHFKDDDTRREILAAVADFSTLKRQGDSGLIRMTEAIVDMMGKDTLKLKAADSLGISNQLFYDNIAKVLDIKGKNDEQKRQKVIELIKSGRVSGSTGAQAAYYSIKELTGNKQAGATAVKAGESLSGLFNSIKGGMQGVFASLDTEDWPGMKALKGFLKEVASLFDIDGEQAGAFKNILKGFLDVLAPLFDAFRDGFVDLKKHFTGSITISEEFKKGLRFLGDALVLAVKVVGYALYYAIEGISLLVDGVKAGWEAICEFGEDIADLSDQVVGFFLDVYDSVGKAIDGIKEFVQKMVQMGKDLIFGFIRGIKEGAVYIKDAIVGIGSSAVNSLKDALGISSPSKEFAKLGRFAALGFAEGMADSMLPVRQAVFGMGDTALATGRSSVRSTTRNAALAANGNQVSLYVTMNVNSYKSQADDVAEEILPRLSAVVRDEMERVFERAALEA